MALTKVTYSMIANAPANVCDFGATGDGTTDDSLAFIAAVASISNGGTLYVPPGEYKIVSTVELPSNITVLGCGESSVIFGAATSDNSDSVNGLFCAKNKSNITLDGLKIVIDPTSGGYRSKFILCNNLQIKNCYFDGEESGGDIAAFPIWIAGCSLVKITNIFSYNARDHVYICRSNWTTGTNSGEVYITDCVFENINIGTSHAYPTGVYAYYCDYITVTDCTFKNIVPSISGSGNTGYGFYEGDGEAIEVNVKNCNFYLTINPVDDFIGLTTTLAETCNIVGCSFSGTSSYKMKFGIIYGAKNFSVESCSFNYVQGSMQLAGTSGETGYNIWSIENNTIKNCVDIGIRIGAGATDVKTINVSGNSIYACGLCGILFNVVGEYSLICNDNLIIDANTSDDSTAFLDSGINVFGDEPQGVMSGNFIANTTAGGGKARYGINLAATYAIAVTSDNVFSNMVTASTLRTSAIPNRGTWDVGDVIWNYEVTAGGVPGWVCVTAGSPGTWKAMATVAA